MANVKITQLPSATTPLTGTEVFPLVQGTTTKQVAITGLFTSPVMTNPTLGTVGQADLINATGLPISTGVAGLGTGIATFLGTPSSANLRAAVTDETGTGSLVFATSPTLVTPNLGTPTFLVATNATGTALGLIAGSAITNANLTGAVTSVGNATSLGSFTSAQLRTALTDETGSGVAVFATSPTLVTPVLGTPQSGDFSTGTFTWPTFNQNTSGTAAGLSATLAIASGGTAATTAASAIENLLPAYAGNGSKGLRLNSGATALEWVADGGGTVTSVAASVPSFLSIAGSPITTSGTLAFSLSGTALPTTSGGTGLTSFTSGGVVYASSTSALATGSALTFDGVTFSTTAKIYSAGSSTSATYFQRSIAPATESGTETAIVTTGNGDNQRAGLFASNNYASNLTTELIFKTNASTGSATEGLRLTSTSLYTASGINVGFGASSPAVRLETKIAANGVPATSGTTQTNGAFRVSSSGTSGILDFGPNGSSPWIQATDSTDLSQKYNLLLNPNGGNVGIGTSSPTQKLSVKAGNGNQAVFDNNGERYTQVNWSNNGTLKGAIWADNTNSLFEIYGNTGIGLSFYTNAVERARIDSSGNLLVGTTSGITNGGFSFEPNYNGSGISAAFFGHSSGGGNGNQYCVFAYNGTFIGSITQSGTTAVLYNVTSDQRLKENIVDADSASALIDSLQVRQYNWKSDGSHQRYGFVAQELVTVAPEAVYQPTDTEDMMAVDYSKLVPMLVKEIQSLRQRLSAANL